MKKPTTAASAPFPEKKSRSPLQEHAGVVLPLLMQAAPVQAMRLALASARLRGLFAEDARAALVALACRRAQSKSPLAALAVTRCLWARAALARRILLAREDEEEEDPFEGLTCLPQLESRLAAWMQPRLAATLPIYERRLQLEPSADRTRSPFTYQHARREGKEGGLFRRFLMLADAHEALCFVHAFWQLQRAAPRHEQITLLECGSYDGTWRKWILDVDAPLAELRNAGLSTDPDVLWVAVLDLAQAVSRTLCERGYLAEPCPFAIVSRHVPERKCSWHVTLCALADYATWRKAMGDVERVAAQKREEAGEWALMPFVDQATLRNSHSQYMQVWGSTKATACDGNCFRSEGVWGSAEEPLFFFDEADATPHQRRLFVAATGLNLHDPWSRPFVGLAAASEVDPGGERVLKLAQPPQPPQPPPRPRATAASHSKPSGPSSSSEPVAKAHWGGLPAEAAWMRAFVDDGHSTRLHYIPSMANPANVPDTVAKARNVWVHAQVSRYTCCPRLLLGAHSLIHQHSNTGMLYCFEDAHGRPRLWIRCFSTKCLADARRDRQRERGWTEVLEEDLLLLRRQPPPPSPAPAPAAAEPAAPEKKEWTDGIPPSQVEWISAPWKALQAEFAPRMDERREVPHCLCQPFVVVKLYASVARCGWLCPRLLVSERVRRVHAAGGEEGDYRVLVAEQSSPKCAGRSYRLFVRCMHPDCAHLRASDPWVELTRLTLLTPRA